MNDTLSKSNTYKVLLIDDHPLFAKGMVLLLDTLNMHCETALTLDSALISIKQDPANLILLDLNLNQKYWVENLNQLRRCSQDNTPIAIISSHDESSVINDVMKEDVQGYIPKSSSPEVLKAAINLLIAGGIFVPKGSASQYYSYSSRVSDIRLKLSTRQRQVLKHAVRGKANKIIANELSLSESTIKTHLSAVYRALGVKTDNRPSSCVKKLGCLSSAPTDHSCNYCVAHLPALHLITINYVRKATANALLTHSATGVALLLILIVSYFDR